MKAEQAKVGGDPVPDQAVLEAIDRALSSTGKTVKQIAQESTHNEDLIQKALRRLAQFNFVRSSVSQKSDLLYHIT